MLAIAWSSLIHSTFIVTNGNKKSKLLVDNNVVDTDDGSSIRRMESEDQQPASIADLDMTVRHKADDFIEDGVNCDSTFMLTNIQKIGEAMQSALRVVGWKQPNRSSCSWTTKEGMVQSKPSRNTLQH